MRDRLAKIEERYPEDPEVLFALACTATALSPDQLIELARVLGPHTYDGAVRAIELFFREPHAGVPGGDTFRLVFSGLLLLEKLDKDRTWFVGGSPIMSQLSASQQAKVASHLKLSRRELPIHLDRGPTFLSSTC